MNPTEQRIWDTGTPIAEDLNLRVVRVLMGGGETPTLQVMLEPKEATPDNRVSVTLDDCEKFSRELSVVLDVEDPVPEAYRLEVSSTGLERPLVTLEDFRAYTPHRVKLKTKNAIAGQKRFTGTIEAVEDEVLRMRHEGAAEAVDIPFADVATAKLAYTPVEEKALLNKLRAG